MGDVASRTARPDHRKSKFGLRHVVKLKRPQFCSAQLYSISNYPVDLISIQISALVRYYSEGAGDDE
jgi:hypothetical protein